MFNTKDIKGMMLGFYGELRTSLHPYGRLRRKFEWQRFKVGERERLAALKDIHKDERCFLIGNGPSLKQHDLRKLIGEKTFVTNMFVLHELSVKISPSYYFITDWVHWSKEGGFTQTLRQGFHSSTNTAFVFEYDARRVVKITPELKGHSVYYIFQEDGAQTVWDGYFTTNIQNPLYWGRTVMIDSCIPLACYMGFKDIYLIGNDYNWNIEKANKLQNAYFYDVSKDDRGLTESKAHNDTGTPEHIALVMKAFKVVSERLKGSGHNIYNAGYGGCLDVFPRVNYDDLF